MPNIIINMHCTADSLPKLIVALVTNCYHDSPYIYGIAVQYWIMILFSPIALFQQNSVFYHFCVNNFVQCCLISSNVALYHSMSPYIAQCCLISPNVALYRPAMSPYIAQNHLISSNAVLYRRMLPYIAECCLTSPNVALYRPMSPYIAQCRLISAKSFENI